jgi:hypothetical protein
MALIKLSGGPLDGQERDVQDPNALAAEYPGYAAVEQVMDPEVGQLVRAEWVGDEATEANYPGSDQERERYGNQTGIRDADAQDRARSSSRSARTDASVDEDPNAGEPNDRTQGKTTGAQKREAKNETAAAKNKAK